MEATTEIHILDRLDGTQVIRLYDRKRVDKIRDRKTVDERDVIHADKEAAKRLIREHDPESWIRHQKEQAGKNPDVILDEEGQIILRPVPGQGRGQIKTKVKPKDYDPGLYDRLKRADFVLESSRLLRHLNMLLDGETDKIRILHVVSEGLLVREAEGLEFVKYNYSVGNARVAITAINPGVEIVITLDIFDASTNTR